MELENQAGGTETQATISFLTIKEHCGRGKRSVPSYYRDVSIGLMTKPIKLGERQSAVPEHESNAIYAARLAGKSNEQIRALVKALTETRPRLFKQLTKDLQLQLNCEQAA